MDIQLKKFTNLLKNGRRGHIKSAEEEQGMDGRRGDHGSPTYKQSLSEQGVEETSQQRRSHEKRDVCKKQEDNSMEECGYRRCPEWLKKAYRKAVKYICEHCHNHEDWVGKLEPHRIKPGYKGGTYRPGNVKMLCKDCHKLFDEKW